MQKAIIIPARMQSKRFPGKVMYPIDGIPMIIRTWQQALKVPDCSVYIASDDVDLLASCQDYGCSVIKTGEHRNGTERCAEAARILGLADDDHVLNLQADLPCINPELLRLAFHAIPFFYPHSIVTAAVITQGRPDMDSNLVKIVLNEKHMALFFSRQPICANSDLWYNHIGIYAMMNCYLQEYAKQEVSPIEQQEDLEQLRFLYYGKRDIKVIRIKEDCISINVPSDLEKLNIQWPDEQVIGHVI
jgi:3-deoxy-manno-octulosonate cytidylyltransferase (CMP-KDO synthetase)